MTTKFRKDREKGKDEKPKRQNICKLWPPPAEAAFRRSRRQVKKTDKKRENHRPSVVVLDGYATYA